MQRSVGRILMVTAALGAGLAASPALASDPDHYFTGGLLLSFPIGGSVRQIGVGVEATWTWYPSNSLSLTAGTGAFVQAQALLGGGFRVALGAQANLAPFGGELGIAWVRPRDRPVETALHLGGFLSGGFASVALRWTRAAAESHASSLDLALGLKYVLHYDRSGFGGPTDDCFYRCRYNITIGRPLVVDGEARAADGCASAAWCDGTVLRDDPTDPALAAHWEGAALDEHASVAAFARATLQLMSLGAPPALLARVQQAALDEIDHARRSFALASRFAGEARGPSALPDALAVIPKVDLAALAVDTLREGCLGESVAADLAAAALADARDPEVRATLAVIARDERAHAALAWDVVAWCVEAGGEDVRRALAEALRAMPTPPQRPGAAATLRDYGVPDAATQGRRQTIRRREALRRYGPGRPTFQA